MMHEIKTTKTNVPAAARFFHQITRVVVKYRSLLLSSRHQQKHRSVTFFLPFGMCRQLCLRRTPVLNMSHGKAKPDQHIEVGAHRPVLLNYAFGKPIRSTRSFLLVMINRPGLVPARMLNPFGTA